MHTLAELVRSGSARRRALLVPDGGPQWTYGELAGYVASLRDRIHRAGLPVGGVVSIVLPNGLDFVACLLAVTSERAVAAPLNPDYKSEEYRFYLRDAGSCVVVVPPGRHPAREAAEELQIPVWDCRLGPDGAVELDCRKVGSAAASRREAGQDDIAIFLHTSGSTSRPKGVPLTHKNVVCSVRNIVGTYELVPDDTSLLVMPLFHVHGLVGVALSTLASGGTLVVPRRFSASGFWPIVRAHRVTWYSAVPTIHQILMQRSEKDGAPSGLLRFVRSCSAALSPDLLRSMEERFGSPMLEAYGMTEAAHQIASNPLPPEVREAGTVGKATGVEVLILNEDRHACPAGEPGEVAISGDSVMTRYHNDDQANAESFHAGYLRTGDRGILDDRGYLTLLGRIKELINRGGEKISPLEVEAVLQAHPAVAEAVAFGVPDEKYGEEIQGAVVLTADTSESAIIDFCNERLADFKVPKRIHIMTRLPRTATGKILRRQLTTALRDR
jgi:acyl-CoA synthetase (AMP-forming)/AMP-acid ligase II